MSVTNLNSDTTRWLPTEVQDKSRKLKVMLLECDGGSGHKTCAAAIKKSLETFFRESNVAAEFVTKDIGSHLAPDILKKFSRGKYKLLGIHNFLAKHGYIGIIELFVKIGKLYGPLYHSSQVKYFDRKLEKHKPDLVISATPLINGALVQSANETNTPVLVATTDADNELFSLNWPKGCEKAPYRYGIPYNSIEIAEKVGTIVEPSKIRGMGYPVGQQFLVEYSEKQKTEFRKELGIAPDKKHIGVMMGGLGGVVTLKYFKELLGAHKNQTLADCSAHYSFFCGDDNARMIEDMVKFAGKLGFKQEASMLPEETRLVHPKTGLSLSILRRSNKVYKYMAVSACFVTKPGSSSFNECLSLGVPMLLDRTSQPLPWEALNIELAETYNFGERVAKFPDFIGQINKILSPENNIRYHHSIEEYRRNRPNQRDFGKNIVQLTKELLEESKKLNEQQAEQEAIRKAAEAAKADAPKPSLKEKIKNIGRKMCQAALKILRLIRDGLVLVFVEPFRVLGRAFIRKIAALAYFSGFDMKPMLKMLRRRDLIKGIRRNKKGDESISQHKGEPIEETLSPLTSPVSKRPIDALCIKSGADNRTGNAVIYVLGKDYQGFHPNNYDHLLNDGADVIFFNPTEMSVKAMDADLKEVIKELKRRNPNQKLALHGYCIGAHVAAAVAGDVAAGKVDGVSAEAFPTIIDRGYGDGYKLAKKATLFARLPYNKRYINEHFNAKALEKIEKHRGAMLFVGPKDGMDQTTHRKLRGKKIEKYNGKYLNLTRQLFQKHANQQDQWVELEGDADHWTPWTVNVHNRVKEFLKESGIAANCTKITEENEYKIPKATRVSWSRRNLMPLVM